MPELITGVAADGSYSRQREALPGTKRIAGPAEAYTYVMNSTTEDVALFKAVENEV